MSKPAWATLLPRPIYSQLKRVEVPSDWFEVYDVQPGVFALYEPRQWEEVISYLVLGERRALLIDTGLGVAPIKPVVRALTQLPVLVINTHCHFDHVGGNHEFDGVVTLDHEKPRQACKADAVRLVELYAREFDPANIVPPVPAVLPDKQLPWSLSGSVRDGVRIDLGKRVLSVITAPGHAPDQICLHDETHQLLFTADHFYEGPMFVYAPDCSMQAFAATSERLAKLVPQLKALLPSHNTPVSDPAHLLALRDAANAIVAGQADPARIVDGRKVFVFSGFEIHTAA